MSFLETALQCAALGWHVFPVARDKAPLTPHGKLDATLDTEQIRAWWTKTPDANIGLSCGPSGLAVLDIDHGLTDEASLTSWGERNNIPLDTLIVRTGSRPEFKVHVYYRGTTPDCNWNLDGCSGQIKSSGGYVLAAGSSALHNNPEDPNGPKIAGAEYTAIRQLEPMDLPNVVRNLKGAAKERVTDAATGIRSKWDLPVHDGDGRDDFLFEQAIGLRDVGCGETAILTQLEEWNGDPRVMADPKPDHDLKRIAKSAASHAPRADEIKLTLDSGKPKRALYDAPEEILEAEPPSFLIEGFMPRFGATGLAARVASRKSLVALNIIRSLLTGEPLFGAFKVVKQPERVLYLCPEVSRSDLKGRFEKIGLLAFVQSRKLRCRSMNSEGSLRLNDEDLLSDAPGSVVVLDTAIRFMNGSDADPSVIKIFVDGIFGLIRAGADAVLIVHHSTKANNDDLTLENALRGGGDLGAFLATCWATRMHSQGDYESLSLFRNVKPRDFDSPDFNCTCDRATLRMTKTDAFVPPSSAKGFKADKDGREAEALAFIKAHPNLSGRKISAALKAMGINRGEKWVREHKPYPEDVQIGG